MREYLKNDICKFRPLFNIDYSKKQNIYSASFFKLKSGSYKDFSKYTNGLKYLDKHITILKNFRIRLFIEKSIYEDEELMKLLGGLKNTDLVLYTCPDFVKNSVYHKGLFSTLVRIFPLFNFSNNDSNIVKITDIDEKENNIKKIIEYDNKFIKKLISINPYLATENYSFFHKYIFKTHKKEWKYNIRSNGYILPYIDIGLHLFNVKKIDKNIFIKYIKEKPKFNKEIKDITSYFDHNNINDNQFIFGRDIYFTNLVLPNFLINNNKSILFTFRYTILENLYAYIKIGDKKYKDYERFFKTIFNNDPGFKFVSIQKSYDYLDKKIYPNLKNKNMPREFAGFIFNIYAYYISIYNKKTINYYNKDFIDLILSDQFLGIYYSGNITTGYNIKGLKTKLVNYNKLPELWIKKLRELKKDFNVKTLKLKIPEINYKK